MKDTITMNYNDLANSFQVEKIRLKMVRYALQFGVSRASREFKASMKTVRKWLNRYDGTRKSLSDLSRRPKNSPNQIPKEVEERIVAYRKRYPTLGARRIKDELMLPYSHMAVHKALKRSELIKKPRKKWRRKRDLRAVKEKMRSFEKIQVDVKYLDDIPEFYHDLICHRLPRYQWTARDVRTGFTFVSYAREFTQTNSVNFMLKLAFSLNQLGIDPKTCLIQTDNGTEFVSGFRSSKRSICETIIESLFAGHRTIPPGACTYQSDVEAFHRRIEEEFYRTERINSNIDFYKKAATYLLWFNLMRYNRYKKGSPMDILCCSDGLPDTIPLTAIFPVLLDRITPYILKQGGYHVHLPDT